MNDDMPFKEGRSSIFDKLIEKEGELEDYITPNETPLIRGLD